MKKKDSKMKIVWFFCLLDYVSKCIGFYECILMWYEIVLKILNGRSIFDHVVLVDVHIGLIFEGLFKYYISLN